MPLQRKLLPVLCAGLPHRNVSASCRTQHLDHTCSDGRYMWTLSYQLLAYEDITKDMHSSRRLAERRQGMEKYWKLSIQPACGNGLWQPLEACLLNSQMCFRLYLAGIQAGSPNA